MRSNDRREGAQIIQFPMNRRFEGRLQERLEAFDPRVLAALDPAWYHVEAIAEPLPTVPPKH